MPFSRTNRFHCQPLSSGWWLCVTFSLHFVVWVNFVPLHLSTEPYLDHSIHFHALGDSGHDDRHEDHGHVPHLASDHSLVLAGKNRSVTTQPAVSALMTGVESPEVRKVDELVPVERLFPPGRMARDPCRPRAPPFV
jgi:hypothetical protein